MICNSKQVLIFPDGWNLQFHLEIAFRYQNKTADYTQMSSYIGGKTFENALELESSYTSFIDEGVSFKNSPCVRSNKLNFDYYFINYGIFHEIDQDEQLRKWKEQSIKQWNYRKQTLMSLRYIKKQQLPKMSDLKDKFVFLPPRLPHQKKTLIFDLDETLIHSFEKWDFKDPSLRTSCYILDGVTVYFQFSVRPYAIEWLKAANEYFQVIVFTASLKVYADSILDILDPDNTLIQYRLYRDSWYTTPEGDRIKDLRIIQNVELQDIAIIENAVHAFGFQLNNGIPILNYYIDSEDEELHHIIPYLKILSESDDVRNINKEAFQIKKIYDNLAIC